MTPKADRTNHRERPANLAGRLGFVRLIVLTVLLALAAAAAMAPTALADRTYETQILGLKEPVAVTVDPSDHLWVSSTAQSGSERLDFTEFNSYSSSPFPSVLRVQHGDEECGGCVSGITFDSANESLYAAGCCGNIFQYGPEGFVPPPWVVAGQGNLGGFIAADNSGGPANGVLYYTENEPSVSAFTPEREPSDFTAVAPYISGNKITGTPSNSFYYSSTSVAVDPTSGDIWVADEERGRIAEFAPSGEFIREVTGLSGVGALAIDPILGNVLAFDPPRSFHPAGARIVELSPTGEFLGEITEANGRSFGAIGGIAFDSEGYLYVADTRFNAVDIFSPKVPAPKITYEPVAPTTPTSGTINALVDPNGGGNVTSCELEYGTTASFNLGSVPCSPSTPYDEGAGPQAITAAISGLTTNTTYYYRLVMTNTSGATLRGHTLTYTPRWVQGLTTEPAQNVQDTTAQLNGSFVGNEEDTHYYFEYGSNLSYGSQVPVPPGNDAGQGEPFQRLHVDPVQIEGLQPGVTVHYRIVASNANGITYGQDETFTTLTKPSITSLSSSNLTATSAQLHATINPEGGDTHYYFEYGTSAAYGSYAPVAPPGEDIGAAQEPQRVVVQLEGLESNVTYHFRVVAENPFGRSVSEDQTLSFFPPRCPNAQLRQETHSAYLPDCRAYELVSPANAGGAVLYPEGPSSPYATNPARLAFGGILGAVPGAGHTPNTLGDLYVATRSSDGWSTKYVGIPGDQALIVNGPPNELNSSPGGLENILTAPAGVRGSSSLDQFADWNEGNRGLSGEAPETPYNYTPYIWSADGSSLGQWPTAVGYEAGPVFEQSADFSHFVFQTGTAPNLSIVDDAVAVGTATVVSVKPNGEAIGLEPTDTEPNYESLRIADVSENGSHILMSVRGAGSKLCGATERRLKCRLQPGHLYMRIDDAVTYDVSQGHIVTYVGATPDGKRVYFTSTEQLTSEDKDTSTDLYMWSQEAAEKGEQALTLISKGDNAGNAGEPGNSDSCSASWTVKCGVVTYENNGYEQIEAYGSFMGNGLSDNFIAADNGDVYFFSPEQLAQGKGVAGQENMYDYREGRVQYVTTLAPKRFCIEQATSPFLPEFCSAGPVARMQVTPRDSRMALLTASKVTSYETAGHLEMYVYSPASEELSCVSCMPDGQPPATNVEASSDGIFMTEDGRVFFSTGDALVPQDTDGLRDVYEYTEGHAQLISSGTSSKDSSSSVLLGINSELFTAGLVGVSENGTDAYFTTYDSLVGQDENGNKLKFYDARTNGGFPYSPPVSPCESADECHGAGTVAPEAANPSSGAALGGGGNLGAEVQKAKPKPKKHKKKKHKPHKGGRVGRKNSKRGQSSRAQRKSGGSR